MILKVVIGKGLSKHNGVDGGYKDWSKDVKHRRECEQIGVFGTAVASIFPWRVTKDQLKELDARMSRIVWPHYMDRLYYDNASFWVKPGRIWKTRRKVTTYKM